MLRILLSMAEKCKNLWKPLKPCRVGIHWKGLTECFQMSTHLPGFQSFFRFFASFCIGLISHQVSSFGWYVYLWMVFRNYLHESCWGLLSHMLLVAFLAKTKLCKNHVHNMIETLAYGTLLRVLSESFPMNTNVTGFRWFSKIVPSLCIGRK